MNQKRKVLAAVLLLAVVAGIAWWKTAQNSHPAAVLYGNVDIRELSLAFRVGGRVAEVLVDEGDPIRAGQVLARLDSAPLAISLHAAQAQLASVGARNALLHAGYRSEDIAQAQGRATAAQAALAEAQAELVRQQQMLPAGATAQHNVDLAQSARDQAQAQLDVANAALRMNSKGYRPQEIQESDALLQQARVGVENAQLALSDAVLRASSEGIVLTRAIENGAMVQAGTPAFSVSLTQPVWVRAYVPEPQLGLFSNGTALELWTDSRPDKPYHGVVGFVSPTAEFTPNSVETTDLRTSLVYRVRVVVNDPDALLRQGMPVTVRRAP